MAVHLRLRRVGTKKRPVYHLVAADSRFPRDGRFLEKLGTYHPLLPKDSEERCALNQERCSFWLSKGAKPTKRVHILLAQKDILPKFQNTEKTKKHLPKSKAQQRAQEKAEAQKAAAESASE